MQSRNRVYTHVIACLAAGWISLSTVQIEANAGDCGGRCACQSTREVCPPPAPNCRCGCNQGKKVNCFKKAFHGLSAGMNKMTKLFSLRKSGCDEMNCDDACDAAMIEELMLPPVMPSTSQPQPMPPQVEPIVPEEGSVEEMPPPIRLQEPPSDPDRGSLFDTKEDPFSDDEARMRSYRPVRPSSYERVELRPIQPVNRIQPPVRMRSSR